MTKDVSDITMEQNFANLIREKARLNEYHPDNDNDEAEASIRKDEVQDTIDNIIYEGTRVIAITKWGRPVLDRAGLDRLIGGLSDEDKTLVRNLVEDRFEWLDEMYGWYVAGVLAPRQTLRGKDVVAKLESLGIHVVWDASFGVYQCVYMLPIDSVKNNPIDHFQLVDDGRLAGSRSLMEMIVGKEAASDPTIELVPLLREIYGDQLAVGEEALPLIDDFEDWLHHYLGCESPQVIEEAEAA